MLHHISHSIEIIAALAACCSIIYYGVCLWSTACFLRERKAAGRNARPTPFPPVSILKPLKGSDPEMYESFRSHCVQDYPEYEIIFGVSEPDDPAIAEVEHLKRE